MAPFTACALILMTAVVAQDDDAACEEPRSVWLMQSTLALQRRELQQPDVAAMVPENGVMCFEGTASAIDLSVAHLRATPLNVFSPHSPSQHGATCASLGFEQPLPGPDACWAETTLHLKKGADANEILGAVLSKNRAVINSYAASHNISSEFAGKWVSSNCDGGTSARPGIHWWGVEENYTAAEVNPEHTNYESRMLLEEARARTVGTGAFSTADGSVCYEGPRDYMENALHRARSTPWGLLFTDVSVQETTCEQLGYDLVRDPRDECWPEASKSMRSASNDADMGVFVLTSSSLLADFGPQHGLDAHAGQDWATCGACLPGGANRDRGMLFTQSGAEYTTRYTDEFCASFLANVTTLNLFPSA